MTIRPAVTGEMRRCKRCGHRARADRMIQGLGVECATRLGLVGGTVNASQSGPDLFDAAEEADCCDGWDRP